MYYKKFKSARTNLGLSLPRLLHLLIYVGVKILEIYELLE